MLRQNGTAIALAVLIGLLSACGSNDSSRLDQYYQRALAEVDSNGAQEAPPERPQGEERRLSAGFTVYPGAEVVSDNPIAAGERSGRVVSITTRASPMEVANFYERQAEEAGLRVDRSTSEQGAVTMSGTKPDGPNFDLTAAQMGDGGTSANLMVLDQPG